MMMTKRRKKRMRTVKVAPGGSEGGPCRRDLAQTAYPWNPYLYLDLCPDLYRGLCCLCCLWCRGLPHLHCCYCHRQCRPVRGQVARSSKPLRMLSHVTTRRETGCLWGRSSTCSRPHQILRRPVMRTWLMYLLTLRVQEQRLQRARRVRASCRVR
jgi:hypothetical protein